MLTLVCHDFVDKLSSQANISFTNDHPGEFVHGSQSHSPLGLNPLNPLLSVMIFSVIRLTYRKDLFRYSTYLQRHKV